jgi:RND superfamily putative drug exporter
VTDAFVVRLTLVPAIMHLLDGRAWYMPRWLDRMLPRVTIEPPTSTRPEKASQPAIPSPGAVFLPVRSDE